MASNSGKLSGRVAIVTGGGQGFGKGIAKKFLDEGANVVIADFVEDIGQKTASELKCEFVRADVTKKADWESLLKFCDDKFGRIDSVINNAGTTYRNKVSYNDI
jgi:NAD(P)-dependent dehydrogenase (short-subunit alcohol dehydrogenase family)